DGPNIYPYNILNKKASETIIFDGITLIYGENGSGKSTLLNLLANLLDLPGAEITLPYGGSANDYFSRYLSECLYFLEEDEAGRVLKIPENSHYIKSEDILYEVKKIQQEAVLREGYLYERRKLGMTKEQVAQFKDSYLMEKEIDKEKFAQEKYSNGQTALQVFEDYLQPEGLYLLDEPETSLSPFHQLKLAELITQCARFLNCQFIIASHSPLFLGALDGMIYDFGKEPLTVAKWQDLPIVRLYWDFFQKKMK